MKSSILVTTFFFAIVDILGYINERTPGQFKIDQTFFQNYVINYVSEESQKQKAKKGIIVEKAQSALVIEEQTGELPVWADNPAILETIAEIKAKRVLNSESVAENREAVNEQIEEIAQDAARYYQETRAIPKTATTNIAVLKRFKEIIGRQGAS